jgi:serine protease AprX
MDRVRKQINIPLQNNTQIPLLTGKGVSAAVLDTGINTHPDFGERIVRFKDFVNDKSYIYDDSGHGTHVCGIMGGNGLASDARYAGIAPEINLIVGKVLDKNGEGAAENMIKGIEWLLDIKKLYHIKVLNISVSINHIKDRGAEAYLKQLIELTWDNGIAVVCAAGNNGPEAGSIVSYGKSRKIITVGCHDGIGYNGGKNSCENYSGRGDYLSPYRKPDIVAPGTDIISCNAFFKYRAGRINSAYTAMSGTSMAAPVVSGVAALFFEAFPHLSCNDFKKRLTYTAQDLGEAWNKQGWGMVNAEKLLAKIY